MKVHFESSDVLIIEKPAGYLSVPSSLGRNDPRPVVGIIAQNQWGRLFPVHRLDFEVAGLLVFARNTKAQTQLHELWESGQSIVKTYKALSSDQSFSHWPVQVKGLDPDWDQKSQSGEWHTLISQGKKRSFVADFGQPSRTRYQQLESGVWNLQPITGRRHQLRLEMSRHGFPILGDVLYGGIKFDHIENEIALVAYKIEFLKKGNLHLPDGLDLGWNWVRWRQRFNP